MSGGGGGGGASAAGWAGFVGAACSQPMKPASSAMPAASAINPVQLVFIVGRLCQLKLPPVHLAERRLASEVVVKRRDGHFALGQCREIGLASRGGLRRAALEPEVITAPRIDAFPIAVVVAHHVHGHDADFGRTASRRRRDIHVL